MPSCLLRELLVCLAVAEHVKVHLALLDVALVLLHACRELALVVVAGWCLCGRGMCGCSMLLRRCLLPLRLRLSLLVHVLHLHRAGACDGIYSTVGNGRAAAEGHALSDGAKQAGHHAAAAGRRGCGWGGSGGRACWCCCGLAGRPVDVTNSDDLQRALRASGKRGCVKLQRHSSANELNTQVFRGMFDVGKKLTRARH